MTIACRKWIGNLKFELKGEYDMWKKTCKEFKNVREMVENEDPNGIMKGLFDICVKYAKENDEWGEDWADDFERLAEDIEFNLEDADEETVDWYLDEFYDLCDAAKVWLEV